VVALEPDSYMLPRARKRAHELRRPVRFVRGTAEALPFRQGAFDTVVVALVLRFVEDETRSLAEVRRVLQPGGTLRFVEHVRVGGWRGKTQDALAPAWKRVMAGCHLNHRTVQEMERAGFSVEIADERHLPGGIPLVAGLARSI
jgi:ubiquinone/menaquinone biosynthesis C-methylase UbiE